MHLSRRCNFVANEYIEDALLLARCRLEVCPYNRYESEMDPTS